MNTAVADIARRVLLCSFLILTAGNIQAQDDEWLNRSVRMTETRGTRYQLLRQVTEKTGYLFVYDSRTLNNDAEVQIREGEYTLRDIICAITGTRSLRIGLTGDNHIVLRLPEEANAALPVRAPVPEKKYVTVSGTVYDMYSKTPIPSATVSVVDAFMGTVTNRDGRFRITLPDSLPNAAIRITHVGYESLELKASSPTSEQTEFMLEPRVVSLQEVVVRVIDPKQAVRQMMDSRERNYAHDPVYLTAFYREGVEHKKRNVDLTEAVLKVYKVSLRQTYDDDQVKLIKMRRILDKQERDTIVTKIKSGILSMLLLDLVRNEPDFMDIANPQNPYVYAHTDIAVIGDRLANVISFEQRKGNKEPLFKGELFIDTENHALAEARFRLNPDHVDKATHLFVEKRSKNFKLSLRGAQYVVSYKPAEDGVYGMNFVRGELEFRVRRKRQWFSSALKVRFELVNCKTDTRDVQPFPRSERLSARTVFSDTKYRYDADFWAGFNVILPEDELKELILNNLMEVATP